MYFCRVFLPLLDENSQDFKSEKPNITVIRSVCTLFTRCWLSPKSETANFVYFHTSTVLVPPAPAETGSSTSHPSCFTPGCPGAKLQLEYTQRSTWTLFSFSFFYLLLGFSVIVKSAKSACWIFTLSQKLKATQRNVALKEQQTRNTIKSGDMIQRLWLFCESRLYV